MTSRHGDVQSAKASDDDVVDAVGLLVGELEDFAFERERVLAKLDIRAAATARRLGRELFVLLRGLPLAADEEAHDEIHDTLGCLLEEAHRILSPDEPAARAASPVVSGLADGPADALAGDEKAGGEPEEEAPLESGERPTSHGEFVDLPLPKGFADEDEAFAEETIARKVSWPRSSNRVLGR